MSNDNEDVKAGPVADTEPDTSGEQASDFAQLQAMAAEGQQAQPVQQQNSDVQQVAKPPPVSAQALMVATMLVTALKPLGGVAFAELKDAPGELWEPLNEGVGAVLDHLGIDRPELQSPWARLAFAMVPLVGYVALQRMLNPKEKPADPVTGTPTVAAIATPAANDNQAPGAKSVSFGAVTAGG